MSRDMTIINSIQTVLDVLESINCQFPDKLEPSQLRKLKVLLGLLRTFYMCGKKWGKGVPHCDSTLHSIEDIIPKHSLKIQSLCLRLLGDDGHDLRTFISRWCHLYRVVSRFVVCIQQSMCLRLRDDADAGDDSNWGHLHRGLLEFLVCIQKSFCEEMGKLYPKFSNGSLQTSSSYDQEVELVDIMDSILHNLQDLLQRMNLYRSHTELMEKLEEMVGFLKNFILFSKFRGLEHNQMEDLLTHTEGLVVDAAYFTFMSWYEYDIYSFAKHQLIEKSYPFESHVCGIYVAVLQDSKLSLSYDHTTSGSHRLMLGEFVHSLIVLLWELLSKGSCYTNISNHQMQKLYGELAFLRTILMEQRTKFDELYGEMNDLIGVVICDAGTMICLLFAGKNEGLEFLFSDLEENFKYIKAKEETKNYPLMPASYFPQTNVLGFTNSLLEKMMSISSYEADSVALAEDTYLRKDLVFVRSFLVDVIRQWDENGKLQALRSRVAMVVYETEFVLDSVVAGDTHQSLVVLLNFIKEEIKLIKVEAMETFLSKGLITKLQNITETYSKMPVASGIPVFNEPVVGLNDEVQKIIDRLTRGTQHLNIVSIVGMAGLGKTTLAQKVYSHNSIIHHFHARSWCCVSQVYNMKRLLLDILSGISGYSVDKHSEMNEDDLAHKLYQHLKKKRYLIVLDDVWDIQVWNSLENSFPDDKIKSRVLLTSRHQNVASQIKPNSEPHNLRSLTNVESWELLKKKICFEGDCASEILTLGKEIAQLCKGLPLMILIVAGILSNTKQDTWKKVAQSLKKGTLSIPEQCRETLEMSYSHLPDYLKPCFLYFGAFEEDQQIPLQELLWLWIAEGFVEKTDRECLEDVAERYMMELIQRSLVMITKKEFIGKVKSCVLHDLLLDFCKAKCNEEQFLHCLHGYELNTSINQSSFHRLCIHYGREDHLESRLLCPRLCTLFFVGDYNIRYGRRDWYDILLKFCQSKLLRVLELRTFHVGPFFPRVIESLVHLRYLALNFRTSDTELTIPSSIDSLSNLETFIVEKSLRHVSLPDTVWNMKKLRHLCTTGSACWTLSEENLEFHSNLENLETLSTVQFSCGHRMMEIMRKFPNIRTLKCKLIMAGECDADCNSLALDFMSQLESLTIFQVHQKFLDLQYFQLPWKLKKLVLSGLCFPWSKISAIDRLPNLEVLKLLWNAFTGEIWDMEEGKFPKLRFLKLADMDLAKWTDADDNFPCLEKLVLDGCPRLNEVPSSLAYISTLQMIEVSCCKSVTSSIKQIHKEQMDTGNEDLKIFIHPS